MSLNTASGALNSAKEITERGLEFFAQTAIEEHQDLSL